MVGRIEVALATASLGASSSDEDVARAGTALACMSGAPELACYLTSLLALSRDYLDGPVARCAARLVDEDSRAAAEGLSVLPSDVVIEAAYLPRVSFGMSTEIASRLCSRSDGEPSLARSMRLEGLRRALLAATPCPARLEAMREDWCRKVVGIPGCRLDAELAVRAHVAARSDAGAVPRMLGQMAGDPARPGDGPAPFAPEVVHA